MNRIEFLKRLGLGGLATATTISGVSKITNKIESNTIQKTSTLSVPEELEFYRLKEDEIFHPIHTDYKVNKKGEISYINYRNKVRKSTLSKHSVHGNYLYRLKDKSVNPYRFVYEAFTRIKLNQSYVVIPKDGNLTNLCIDNLQCIRKKDYHKYEHTNLKKKPIRNSKGQTIKWI